VPTRRLPVAFRFGKNWGIPPMSSEECASCLDTVGYGWCVFQSVQDAEMIGVAGVRECNEKRVAQALYYRIVIVPPIYTFVNRDLSVDGANRSIVRLQGGRRRDLSGDSSKPAASEN
jgi:hypothetical protein